MSDKTLKIVFGGKLSAELETIMNDHAKSKDPIKKSLAQKFASKSIVVRGNGAQQPRLNLTKDEALVFAEDVMAIHQRQSNPSEGSKTNRLVVIQAARTKRKLDMALKALEN